ARAAVDVGSAEDLDAGRVGGAIGPVQRDLRAALERCGGEVRRSRVRGDSAVREQPKHREEAVRAGKDFAVADDGIDKLDRSAKLVAQAGAVAAVEFHGQV